MDHARGTRIAAVALLAFFLSAGPAPAEVKLRIYLQDGTLQSGSLVTETVKSFVVLTQQGRVEVPKNSIMFINGKTLKQWQDRPDKLFQTEIIPSDVPDPAYVNDKSLPPAPPIPKMPASARAAAKAAPKSQKATIVAVPAPIAPPAIVPVEKKPAPAAPRKERPVHRVREAPKPAAEAAAPVRVAPGDPGLVVRRVLFDRQAEGERHYQRAIYLLQSGETGRAIQEFQFARLLTPGNADVPLQLGRLYLAEGLEDQAQNYFAHPLLRRNDEATSQISRIDFDRKAREETDWRWKVGAVAGCFAWLPFLIASRLLRRRRKPAAGQTTINADDLRPEEWLPSAVEEMASPIRPAPPAPVAAEPPPLEEPPPMPEPKTFPGLPEFLKNLTAPEPVAEEPAELAPAYEPDPFVAPEPVTEEPAYEPVASAPMAAASPLPPPDPNEILSLARTMEASLVRGNQHAVEGRFEEARRSYRTALVFNPSCASAHLGLGYLSFCEEKWETSLLHYRKALEIDPLSADAHYGAARVLLEINRVDDALPELRATLQIDPTYDDARDTLTALSKPA